jgi:uncharacterized protein (TIGR02246 family)
MTRDVEAITEAYTRAWNSGAPDAVAAFYAETGRIAINGAAPREGREGVAAMAAGFFADVPDLSLTCDGSRVAGGRVVHLWTFTGHDAATGKPLRISGWEEWDLDADGKVAASLGWFDAADYARQVAG